MGFEKALRSIERNPRDAEKQSALLLLVNQEKDADLKAEAFAGLAQALAPVDVVAAFDHIESAFKISPHNATVLRALVALFERRGRRDAAEAVRAYAKNESVVGAGDGHRKGEAKDGAREGRHERDARDSGPPRELRHGRQGRDARETRDGREGRDPSARQRRRDGSDVVGLGAAPLLGSSSTEANHPALSARENDHCRALLRKFDLDEGLMAVAAEFADPVHSVVSLVHFCHYLLFTGRLRSPSRAVAWVRARIDAAPSPTRARDRARELLEDFDAHAKER